LNYNGSAIMSHIVKEPTGWKLCASLATLLLALPLAGQSPVAPAAIPNPTSDPVARPQASLRNSGKAARKAYEQGLQAERADDWEAAFQAYRQAASESPGDRTIQLHEEVARSQVAQLRAREAEREILSGQNDTARASLQSALQLDPSYSFARERLEQLADDVRSAGQPGSTAPDEITAPDGPQLASGPPKILPQPGKRDFNFEGGTRGAYQAIAQQFGLTAAFDGDLADRQIRFRVTGVDFATAMRVLGEQTGTFFRSLDSRTFFVAADTAQKRKDYAPEVKLTIPLPASETTDEMTETMRMVRDIVGVVRTDLDTATHTLTVRDTLENVALARALVKEIEQPHGELILDIDILEVDRQAAENLGISPPTSARVFTLGSAEARLLEQAPNIGSLIQVIQNIFGTQTPLAGAAGGLSALIPPLIAFGGGKTIFLATLPGASANFAQSLSAVRQAQRVLLRVQDGKPATFFVGERFPITLALLSGSLATSTAQFTSSALAGSFPQNIYPVGTTPRGVAVGEFNAKNNSNLDLAVVNQGSNNVSILLGNGDGTFNVQTNCSAGQTTCPTGSGPVAIATGTFNTTKDSNLDLAVVNQTDGTVSILLGNGDGTFTKQPADIKVGNGPVAIAVGNFNTNSSTDNFPDLAVVNQTDGTVSILLGNGDGTFTKPQPPNDIIKVGNGPVAIVSGSLDSVNNSNADLAVVNQTDDSVSILLGNGDGTFKAEASTIAVGKGPTAIAAGNFDTTSATNNFLGLAVTNGADGTVSILLGNGNGTFDVPTPSVIDTQLSPVATLSADFNNDGAPDLVVVNEGSDSVSVFLGLGNGTFLPPLNIATGNSPVALAEGLLSGNGFADLAVANEMSNTVSVIVNSNQLTSLLGTPTAGLSPYPGSEYVDLGLKVQATSRMHPNGEATLALQMVINSLSGQNVNGIPIVSNRSIEQSVRLQENQTSVLSGLMESSEIQSLSGLPWLANAGPLGYLGGTRSTQQADTELLIAITPRQMRLPLRTDQTIYAGRGEGSAPPPVAPPTVNPAPAPIPLQGPGAAQPPIPGAPGTPVAPQPPAPPVAGPGVPTPEAPAAPPPETPGAPAPTRNAPPEP
jgi:type II secretory pathway component GspD/PulD (secretin)